MKIDSKDVALTAVFAALYVVINVLQMFSIGNPTVYGPLQLRVADCLLALAALFGWPVIGGVTLGCFVSNNIYFLGPQDVVLGSVANLVASSVIFLLRKHRLLACLAGALPIGIIVGSYLPVFFPPPDVLSFWGPYVGMIISITLSSLVAVVLIGYPLLLVMSRPSIIEPLKSHGLKVATRSGEKALEFG